MYSFERINIKYFIKSLSGDRYKTFIIHSGPKTGKSEYAKLLAKRINGKYIDLLKTFKESPDLRSKIDVFGIKELENLLISEGKKESIIILDNIEFLLNTWDKDNYDLLFILIFKKWDSFKISYKPILGVFLVSNSKIFDLEINTVKGEPRILHLNSLESLKGDY
jgi:hypothetical protein